MLASQGVAVVPNSLDEQHILENLDLDSFSMAPQRIGVLNQLRVRESHCGAMRIVLLTGRLLSVAQIRELSFRGVPPGQTALFPYNEVTSRGILYLDDGTVLGPESDYEYDDLTIDLFERMDLGDQSGLNIKTIVVDGDFPGVDCEPVEE
jgi:hypothetical protein